MKENRKINKSHLFLFGNTGIIGSYIEKTFQVDGWVLSGINSKNVDLTSLSDIKSYVKNISNLDTILFLIGLAHAKGKDNNYDKFKDINYQTLHNLLTALNYNKDLPNKIIFASTISVYGEKYDRSTYNENMRPNPFSPYAITKLEAEQHLMKKYSNISWILRFAPVYSSTFSLNIDRRTKIGNLFYRSGNGSNKLSICNIKNIKSVIEGIINNDIPPGVYNISDNRPYDYNELLKWQGSSFVFRIPKLIFQFLYYFGKLFGNTFLKENITKLLTDNIYPNNKITAFIELPYTLNDIKLDNKVKS